jgi:vitamin B12 transporter
MNKCTLAVLAALQPLAAFAHPIHPGDVPPDSLTPRYSLGEIVVTATRTAVLPAIAPSPVTLVPRSRIALYGGSTLGAALEGTPGISFHAYGAGLSVQTVSLRGMPSEHSLVLVDGERYNSEQNGLADFSLVSSSDVDHVEIVRGGYSSLYGADAIGGVINIITQKPPDRLTGSLINLFGSNRLSANELSLGTRIGETGFRAMLRRERGRGDYAFRFGDGVTTRELHRSGGDFSMIKAEMNLDYGEGEDFTGAFTAAYTEADRGSPGPVTDATTVGRARLYDRISEARGNFRFSGGGPISFRLNYAGRFAFERYTDPGTLLGGQIANSEYTNRNIILSPEMHFGLSPAFSGTVGLEFNHATLFSNETHDARRDQRSAFVSTQHAFSLPWEIPFEIIFFPSLRFDSYSDVDNGLSPRIGVNAGMLKGPVAVRLRSSVGRSYHAPVFNDLYWRAGGNPDLRPEHATTFDAGVVVDMHIEGSLHIDATYFDINADNHVVWLPGSGGFWSPKNITSISSRGVEAELSWTSRDSIFTLLVNSTWTDARKRSADFPGDPSEGKRLIYVPGQTAVVEGDLRLPWGTIFVCNFWSSFRYTTEVNDHFLPSYATTSAAFRFGIPIDPARVWLTLELRNIFNTSYELVALYPMPLREMRGTVEVTL